MGTEKNLSLAFDYFGKSAELGYDVAQVNLANCYEQGWGTPVDLVEAYKWFSIANQLGFDAKISIESICLKLTSDQLLAAEKLATSWLENFRGQI